ncbi:hypothetical protein [Salibacterium lacus]|uniref:Uncharacterized protein n=1 Tax=Salibacterium lacus TaxID=1898109 RepID=A0ABW5T5S6_9BACI
MKIAAGLLLGAGLLTTPFSDFSISNNMFFQKDTKEQQEETSEEVPEEKQWEERWDEARQAAEEAGEDTRTEEEKLEDFDENWNQFGQDNTSSSSGGTESSGWSGLPSIGIQEPDSDGSHSETAEESEEESSFNETWNDFGQKFDNTYEQTEDSFDWESSFDSRSGTYQITEQTSKPE